MARSKIYKFTVAENDQLVHEWIKLQNKASFSITMAIHDYIERNGMRDIMGVNTPTAEQQNLVRMQSVSQMQVASMVSTPAPQPVMASTPEPQPVVRQMIQNVQVSQPQPEQIMVESEPPTQMNEVMNEPDESVGNDDMATKAQRDMEIAKLLNFK